MRLRVAVVALLLGGLATGCGAHAARVRFANEFHCPIDDVAMEELGANSHRVTGCGRSVVYVCLIDGFGEGLCSMDSAEETRVAQSDDVRRRSVRATSRPRHSAGTVRVGSVEVPALRLDIRGTNMVIAPIPSGDSELAYRLVLRRPNGLIPPARCRTLSWLADGERIALRAEVHDRARLEFRISSEQMSTIVRASDLAMFVCDYRVALQEAEHASLRDLAAQSSPAPAADPSPSADPRAPPEAEPALRAYVDARRDGVLACAGRAAVGVVLTWSADGSVDVALQAPLTSTPEEECVRNLLHGISAAGAATPGRLIHVVTAG